MAPDAEPASGVRWAQGPHLFELRSAEPCVLERAAIVFRPWVVEHTDEIPTRTWTVAHSPDNRWRVHGAGESVDAVRVSAARAVTAVEYLAVHALTESRYDALTLHAALVARDDAGVLLLGAKQSGKSTLATALWRRGYALFGDDVAVVDVASRSAEPVPRRVSLRSTSRSLLGEVLWDRILSADGSDRTDEGLVFHPDEIDGVRRTGPVLLTACVFLNRGRGALTPGVLRRLTAGAAALALLPYTNVIRRADTGDVIARIAPFAADVSAYDLARADLATMCDAVDALVRAAACR